MMGMCANAQERSYDDWVALLAAADRRFRMRGVIRPPHAILSIIEVVWTGGEARPAPSPVAVAAEPLHKAIDGAGSDGDQPPPDAGSHDFDFGSEGTAVGDDSSYVPPNPTTADPKSVAANDADACENTEKMLDGDE